MDIYRAFISLLGNTMDTDLHTSINTVKRIKQQLLDYKNLCNQTLKQFYVYTANVHPSFLPYMFEDGIAVDIDNTLYTIVQTMLYAYDQIKLCRRKYIEALATL